VIYFADLHIHSRYSRATSPDCNLVELARWAALKGIKVLATGDFTHPQWSQEIRDTLEDAGDGLFRIKDDYLPEPRNLPGGFGPGDVRFLLNVEISSIYKRDGATRKVHNLVFMPDLDSMARFNARLDRIGNIKSDGRPILGLDSRHLLEIALETTPESFFVPAHVWTPWFSILGSKSGFDSVEECFGDLSNHIFALETGLSSDPEMNYRVCSLDKYTLISNSDTHSPSKLGREANIFQGTPGYFSIREALQTGGSGVAIEGAFGPQLGGGNGSEQCGPAEDRFLGTIEFFPEEGKYHLDGHRNCNTRLEPEETAELGGLCPVCGRKVTVGVMNRVMELADRGPGIIPEKGASFRRMLPLVEIVSQALNVGVQSRKVQETYLELLGRMGPEMTVLCELQEDEIARHSPPVIVEAVRRVRRGEVSILAGYDGEYGKVELFGPGEREHFAGQEGFFSLATPKRRGRPAGTAKKEKATKKDLAALSQSTKQAVGLNEEQQRAIATHGFPVLVQAGPGTGKTSTLAHRIADLLARGLATPEQVTAVTFTRKAAAEMKDRLVQLIGAEAASACWVGTFHQLGARLAEELSGAGDGSAAENVLGEDQALHLFREAAKEAGIEAGPGRTIPSLYEEVSLLKQNLVACNDPISDPEVARAYSAYEQRLNRESARDLDDLIVRPARMLQADPERAALLGGTIAAHLLVDEFQDVNRAQYEIVRLLKAPEGNGLFAIGDPDQAIYGFRGADRGFFLSFEEDFPTARRVTLRNNYRSQSNIVAAAGDVLCQSGWQDTLIPMNGKGPAIKIVTLPNAALEAKFILRTIEEMIGGSSFFALDSGTAGREEQRLTFRDFAVLFRLNALGDALEEVFGASGIPFQRGKGPRPEEEAEALDPRAEAVTMMTFHAAKGLEYPVVFVTGCEEGIVPYIPPEDSNRKPSDIDEEMRLLYVAMTRARQELFLTRARQRVLFGRRLENGESRFLAAVRPSVSEALSPLKSGKKGRGSGPKQCELFGEG